MERLTNERLNDLIERRAQPAISLYLPTHLTGAEMQQDPIRLKNRIREAINTANASYRRVDVEALLEPIEQRTADPKFWHERAPGLAIFVAPDSETILHLPAEPPELTVVAERFHVKPLLAMLTDDTRFHVLALSAHAVRLLEATQSDVRRVPLPGVPGSLEEARKWFETERPDAARRRSHKARQTGDTLYTGRGHQDWDAKDELASFFRQVDDVLTTVTPDPPLPLVLAGVESQLAVFRGLSDHPHIVEAQVTGNPDRVSDAQLRDQAWAALAPEREKRREAASARYAARAGTGGASEDLAEALAAAHEGRVESLFVAVGVQRWGRFDTGTHSADLHERAQDGDQDLLDLLAVQTLMHKGEVFAVPPEQLPATGNGAPLAAVFRY